MSFLYVAPTNRELFRWQYGTSAPAELGRTEVEPGGKAVFICRDPKADPRSTRLALLGRYGLVMPWQRGDDAENKYLCVAKAETAADSRVFSAVWAKGRHCIVPLQSFEKSRPKKWWKERMRISSRDEDSLGVAGLWSVGKSSTGAKFFSFALVSISAETDPIMRHFRYEDQPPRMPLFVHRSQYDGWLDVEPGESMALIPKLYKVA